MNTIKFALLGTAAIAAVSVSAQASTASDVAALRAQVEALSAQVAAAQTAADLPSGYQFVTTSMQPSLLDPTRKAYTIAIMPTADAPSSTVLQWSGEVRAALVFTSHREDWSIGPVPATAAARATKDADFNHINVRGQLNVTGKTDTAVGEVGATLKFRENWDGNLGSAVFMPTAIGYWNLTPNLTLSGGFDGIVGGIGGYGTDKLNAYYTDGTPNASTNSGDTSQFALAYADGPISFKVAVGHYVGFNNVLGTGFVAPATIATADYAFGAQAEYKGDSFSGKVAGFVHGGDYQVGVGATASMDMFTLSASAAIGHNDDQLYKTYSNAAGLLFYDVEAADFWNASVFAGASLSDSVKAEIGAGYTQVSSTRDNANKWGVAGGIYYSPVSQLTIGAEASWNKTTTNDTPAPVWTKVDTDFAVDLVTVFKF